MYTGVDLKPPLFELGLKAYVYGQDAVELARVADRISGQYGVGIIFTPQYVDIPAIAQVTERLFVFAQHIDPIEIGRGNGSVLAEAVKAAGAAGVLLNHAEKRLSIYEISNAIRRADEVGLLSMVCADSPQEAAAIAHLAPNVILAEPSELIGGAGQSVAADSGQFIRQSKDMVKRVDPRILVLNSAGIRTADDVAEIIRLGADATGVTSAVVKADRPPEMLEDMIKALSDAWRVRHHG